MLISRRLLVIAAAAGGLAACQDTAPARSAIGGPFQLLDQDGRVVDQSILEGKWSAVFFGYTFCPDFCPNTLSALRAAEAELGRRAEDFQAVFVTVDPVRDTPARLKLYLGNDGFPRNIIGLTGTTEQVAAVIKTYRAYAQKTGEGEDYLMDHSTVTYLMDPKGRFVRPLSYGMPPAEMADAIRDAMRQG